MIKTRFSSELPEQGQDYIFRMQKSASRMRVLIDDLLIFSSFSSRVKPCVKIDLNKELNSILSDLEVLINENKATVEIETLPVLEVDPHLKLDSY